MASAKHSKLKIRIVRKSKNVIRHYNFFPQITEGVLGFLRERNSWKIGHENKLKDNLILEAKLINIISTDMAGQPHV